MERLTEKLPNGEYAVLGCGSNCKHEYKYCDQKENCPTIDEILQRLGYLEDKGVYNFSHCIR